MFLESTNSTPSLSWNEILPKKYYDKHKKFEGNSHTRKIYVDRDEQGASHWVVKLEDSKLRVKSNRWSLPHADEIVYKINKIMGWNTVPKTKMLHEYDYSSSKYEKYFPLMFNFLADENLNSQAPHTFTFQAYVSGEALPDPLGFVAGEKMPDVSLSSYQKNYLLNIILGRYDARCDNCVRETKTGDLYQIDNEYIGLEVMTTREVLDHFPEHMKQPISDEIIKQLMNLTASKILALKDKYLKRDLTMAEFWKNEKNSVEIVRPEEQFNKIWNTFCSNLSDLQKTVTTMKNHERPLTTANIKQEITWMRQERFNNSEMNRLNLSI